MIAPDPALAGPRPNAAATAAARAEPGRGSEPQAAGEAEDFASVLAASGPRRPGRPTETPSEEAVPLVSPAPEATPGAVPLVSPAPEAAPGAVPSAIPETMAAAVPGTTPQPVPASPEAASSGLAPAKGLGEGPTVGDLPRLALPDSAPASTLPPVASDALPSGAAAESKATGRATPGPVQAPPAAPELPQAQARLGAPNAAPPEKPERQAEPDRPASAAAAALSSAPAPAAAATSAGPTPVAPPVTSDPPLPHWHLAPEAPAPARAEPVPAAPSPAPTASHAAIGQLAAAVGQSTDGQVEIRLDPPELGRVQIHLAQADGGLQAVVLADRPETQDLLRRHADQLTRELEAAGYQRVSLDFGAGAETAARSERHEPAALMELGAPPDAAAAPTRPMAPTGGLDIRL